MDDDNEARLRGSDDTAASRAAIAAKALAFDPARYRHHLAHLDMSEGREAELLEAVWRIMRNFVDLAFGDDPAQQARIAGDRSSPSDESGRAGTLGSSHSPHSGSALAARFRHCGAGDWKERRPSDEKI